MTLPEKSPWYDNYENYAHTLTVNITEPSHQGNFVAVRIRTDGIVLIAGNLNTNLERDLNLGPSAGLHRLRHRSP